MIRLAITFALLLAAPFGARWILLLSALFVSPLYATSISYSDEPRAVIGELSNRLRLKFQNNGGQLDQRWLNGELATRADLEGSYCDASNYGFVLESTNPPVVVVVYHKRLAFQPRSFFLRAQLFSGKSELVYGEFPKRSVIFPWPPDTEADARRNREQWFTTHFQLFVHLWLISTNVWLAVSGLFVVIVSRRNRDAGLTAGYAGLFGSLCGWLLYWTAMIDWSIGNWGAMWFVLATAGALSALYSLAFNPVLTRAQLSLACAVASLLLPPVMVFSASILELTADTGKFVLALGITLVLSFLALIARYRKTRQ